jgi:hypothetical protein
MMLTGKNYVFEEYESTKFDDENNLYIKINNLPEFIVEIIKSYIREKVLLFLNKSYYIKYHFLVYDYIKYKSEIYIRTIVRKDLDYILNILFFENITKWINMKNYYYKDCVYLNYIYFLYYYCIENESHKCKELLLTLLLKNGFKKNQHKKKILRYIKWKT